MGDDELARAIGMLKPFCRRGDCVDVLRKAGLSEGKIKAGMALLTKHFPLGCIYAFYRRHEFLQAFGLQDITAAKPRPPQPGAT